MAAFPLAPLALCMGYLPLLAAGHGVRPIFAILVLMIVTVAVVVNILAAVKDLQKSRELHG